jgi:hypothetical protein
MIQQTIASIHPRRLDTCTSTPVTQKTTGLNKRIITVGRLMDVITL